MSFKSICKWCMRFDCKEKGGSVEKCPVDRNEGYDSVEMIRLQKEYLKREETSCRHLLKERIKLARKELNLTQEKLAYKSGVTISTIIKLESGYNKNPTIITIYKISKALKKPLTWFMENDETT